VDVALRSRDQLGEGPVWDGVELLRVDITAAVLHRWDPVSGAERSFVAGDCLTAAIPRRDGGLVVARRHRLEVWDADGAATTLGEVEADRADNRFNDCKCDPAGRLWAGTMSTVREPGAAALYRVEPGGGPRRVLAGTTISNGLGWSPAGDRMYFIDSPTQRVDRLDYDLDTGSVRSRRALVAIPGEQGLPDGMTVDAEGGIWLCLFGGAAVHRYTPDGRLAAVARLPVSNPTSLTFGGPRLDTLYVTSARHRLTLDQLRAEPLAGAVFALEPGVPGLPVARFAG
jgi:sugar lactone lactonase YvrE